jgi:hypothetical protein
MGAGSGSSSTMSSDTTGSTSGGRVARADRN